MAGYVKIWTLTMADSAFQTLTATERGVFLQLIIICKTQSDDGYINVAKMSQLATNVGCDRRTMSKVATNLLHKCLIELKENKFGGVTIFLPNYLKWQEATVKDVVTKNDKNATKMLQKCRLLDQTIPDQTTPLQKDKAKPKDIKREEKESDITAFVEIYHQECPTLPRVREITEPRKKRISACLKKCPDLEKWRAFFKHRIHKSDFLAGRKSEWKASLDWILKPANYIKITEGVYDNKTRPTMSAADQYAQEDAVHRRTDAGHEKEQTIGEVLEGIAEKYQGVEE